MIGLPVLCDDIVYFLGCSFDVLFEVIESYMDVTSYMTDLK